MFLFFYSFVSASIKIDKEGEKEFINYMRMYNLLFTGEEYHFRLGVYLSTVRYVNDFNKQKKSFKLRLNHFSHLTLSEYQSLLGVKGFHQLSKGILAPKRFGDSYDWRSYGVVNDIKDQGNCGSSWAFSTIFACESAWAIRTGKLLNFSEQNLIDCDTKMYGCEGGYPDEAWAYLTKYQNSSLMLNSDYPYQGFQGNCQYNSTLSVGSSGNMFPVLMFNEDDLANKIYFYGVTSNVIDASSPEFEFYDGGIYDDPFCSNVNLNHAVGCVGYGSDGFDDYWIVRNSWGEEWGEGGYIRMSRNQDNQCGIASSAFVLVD